jgi:hypothetical protein
VDIIKRKHLKNKLTKGAKREYYSREYKIYRKEEAAEHNIQFVNWRTVDVGQWGLTDDGWVAECTKRKQYQKKTNIVFSFGQVWYNPKTKYGKCEYEPHRATGSYSMVSSKPAWQTHKGKSRYKNFVKVYVAQMLKDNINYKILGEVFGESKNHDIKARLLLKKEYVKEMIDKELKKVFDEKGISEGTVIDMIQNAHNVASGKADASNMLRAAENFVKILGMDDKKKETDTFEGEIATLERIQDVLTLDESPKKLSSGSKKSNNVQIKSIPTG